MIVQRSSKKKKEKRRQRPVPESSMSIDELMDTPTFKRFSKAVDSVIEGAEDIDFSLLEGEHSHFICCKDIRLLSLC